MRGCIYTSIPHEKLPFYFSNAACAKGLGIIRAYEQRKKSLEERVQVVEERFAEDGVDLDRPFLNPGSIDSYRFRLRLEQQPETSRGGNIASGTGFHTEVLALALRYRRDQNRISGHGLHVSRGRLEAKLDRLLDEPDRPLEPRSRDPSPSPRL